VRKEWVDGYVELNKINYRYIGPTFDSFSKTTKATFSCLEIRVGFPSFSF